MWMLSFIPDSILNAFVNIILITGVVSLALGFALRIRFFENWRMILQVVGVMATVAGLYLKGGYSVEMAWREKVAELEAKVKAAEAKSLETNTVIKEKVVTKIQKVKEVQVKVQEVIKEKEKIINAECVVPKEAVDILNEAARGPVQEKK